MLNVSTTTMPSQCEIEKMFAFESLLLALDSELITAYQFTEEVRNGISFVSARIHADNIELKSLDPFSQAHLSPKDGPIPIDYYLLSLPPEFDPLHKLDLNVFMSKTELTLRTEVAGVNLSLTFSFISSDIQAMESLLSSASPERERRLLLLDTNVRSHQEFIKMLTQRVKTRQEFAIHVILNKKRADTIMQRADRRLR